MRYTLLRLLVFLAFLLGLYLVGLRGIPLVLIAGLISSFVSLIALAGVREDFARTIQTKVDGRREKARTQHAYEDEDE